jgi:hypothetical protein
MKQTDLEKLYARLIAPGGKHPDVCVFPQALTELACGTASPELRVQLEREVGECTECTADLAELKQALTWFEHNQRSLLSDVRARLGLTPGRLTVFLADAGETVRRVLAEVLEGIGELARVQPPAPVLATGMRSGPGERIEARLSWRDEVAGGTPELALSFVSVRAEIEPDGRLILDISTLDNVPPGIDRIEAALCIGEQRVILPATHLTPDGRATIVARLLGASALPRIPISAVELRLIRSSQTGAWFNPN